MEFQRTNSGKRIELTSVAVKAESPGQPETIILVGRAVDGDLEAFGSLYAIFMERIYRYVFYQVMDRMTAEDITEDVFLKAWQAIHTCRGKEHTFSSWLYRIARNQVITLHRIEKKHLTVNLDDCDILADGELDLDKKLVWQDLLAVISGLPQNQRQVILLKFIEGLDIQEIVRIMGKSQGAIRILQMRALANIRQKLGEGTR